MLDGSGVDSILYIYQMNERALLYIRACPIVKSQKKSARSSVKYLMQ